MAHAVRWAFGQQQLQQRQHAQAFHGWTAKAAGSRHYPWTPPQIALHVRAMNDHRAKNLTAHQQMVQMQNAMLCVRRAVTTSATSGGGDSRAAAVNPFVSALVVSSSPDLRTQ